MRIGIAISLVIGFLVGTYAPSQEAGSGLDGTWKLITGEADGKALASDQLKGGKLVIKGNNYTVTIPKRSTITGTQKLDSSKSPKTIDIMDAAGANKGKTCLGIYEVKGDQFRVAFAPPGKARPTTFATAPDSGQWMHVWKRVKD